jgi:hypothetical protein
MIAVVSHDAGGAEVLSSYVRRNDLACVFSLEGPARNVFARKLGSVKCVALDEAIGRASWVLCGTSWQSDLEWHAVRLAREADKHTVTFLDHWVNYRERFERAGVVCLPDEIWVGDEEAARIARDCFGELPVRMVRNPYFEDVRMEIEALQHVSMPHGEWPVVLYVCEPLREHALRQHGDERYWGYVEEEALEYFLENLSLIAINVARILVRPHPSEPAKKYEWVAARSKVPVEISTTATLTQDIVSADIVVGCSSMAMVVALLAGKRVISSIPPGGRVCPLPHAAIEYITSLVESRST